MNIWIWVAIIVVVVMILMFLYYYNSFITLLQRIKNSKSQITVQLKKRSDLVPNLVNMVKGYMKHEKSVLTEVTNARASMMKAKGFEGKVKAGNQLQDALKSLFAVSESYPDLKASQNFLQLQTEVAAIEDKVAYARQYYNDSILSYNTMTQKVPGMWFAGIYGFKKQDYFEIPEEEKAAPKVQF
jgi:LemA protein